MKKINKENIIVVCTIVLCFMLTLALTMMFSGDRIILDVFNKTSVEQDAYFMIAIGGYKDLTIARQSAELIKAKGGAGYVINGENIEIIYAVYKDENVANKVLENLKDKGAYVKKIDIAKSKLSWCDKDMKDDVKNAIAHYDLCFETLYNVSTALNNNEMTISDANIKIKVLRVQIEEIKSNFYEMSKDYDMSEITEIKLSLVTTLALIDNIKISNDFAQTLSSIRYQITQLVLCQQAMMKVI